MKIKITMQDLKDNPNKILVSGITTNDPLGINMSNTREPLRFVFKVGDNNDWAVYVQRAYKSEQEVAEEGDKAFPDTLKNIFDLSPEVIARWRA